MALAIARTRPRPQPALLDRALGTSRRRRQAAYVAFAAGYALFRPTLRRLGLASLAGVFFLSLLVLWVAITRG